MLKTKRFKKGLNGAMKRKAYCAWMERTGWTLVSEADAKAYSGGKGLLLGILFLPLALLGGTKYIDVTHEK